MPRKIAITIELHRTGATEAPSSLTQCQRLTKLGKDMGILHCCTSRTAAIVVKPSRSRSATPFSSPVQSPAQEACHPPFRKREAWIPRRTVGRLLQRHKEEQKAAGLALLRATVHVSGCSRRRLSGTQQQQGGLQPATALQLKSC
eukprot:1068493-Amphidinium_carterae.1